MMNRTMWLGLILLVAGWMALPPTAQAQDPDKTERLDAEQVLVDGLKTARAKDKKVLVHLGAPW